MDTGMCTGASSRIECGSESWAAGGFRRGAAPSRGRRGAGRCSRVSRRTPAGLHVTSHVS